MNSPNAPTPSAGETLPVLTFGDGPELVVAVHGITASAMTWPAVARQLSTKWTLVAPDLRGRGEPPVCPGRTGYTVMSRMSAP
jgi:pimeloyl-ACP methyl ester carboxylesterase